MASPFNRKNNRSRFQSSSIPISTKYASAFSSGSKIRSRHESGAGKALRSTDGNDIFHQGSAHSSTSIATTGINYNAFSSSTIPMEETVPSENRTNCGGPSSSDVFIFEAKDSDDNNNNNNTNNNGTNDNCSASRTRAIKSGRRSGKVPAQPTLFTNDSFQPFDHRCNSWKNQCSDFDRFLFEQWKSSSWQDAHEDVHRQFHSWDPFQAQTAADDDSATNNNNNHHSNTSSSPGIGDSVFNPTTNEVEVPESNVPGTMAGTGSGGGAEFNSNENFSGNLSGHEHCEPKAREMGDFHGTDHEAFVFTASKPKPSVAARGVQEFQSSNCSGEFEASRVSCHGLKSNYGRGSHSMFAAEGPIIGSSFASSVGRSAGESTDSGPIPSIFIANAGGKFASESKGKDSGKQNPLVEHSASTGAASSLFCRVSEKNTLKGAASDGAHGRAGTGGIFSPLESSTPKDSLSERDDSWHFADDSPSTSNRMFEFGASKGNNARRKGSMKYVPSSNDASIGHLGHHTGGKLSTKSSPCKKSAIEDAAVAYRDMPDLEQPFMPWDSLFKPGHENQLNLHQSIGREDNVEELSGANANFHTVIDQQINAEYFHQGESPMGGEHQSRWSSADEEGCGIPTGSNKWKWLFEERTSAASSGNDWFNSTFEKLRTDDLENGNNTTTAKVDASNQRRRFASAASSGLSFSASGPARKNHRPNAKFKMSDKKLDSSFGMQPFGLQTETGQGHMSGRNGDLSDHTVEKEKIAIEASYRFLDPVPVTGPISLLPDQRADSGLPTGPVPVKSAISEHVSEKWRVGGNQAYATGDFPKAEEYYSCGISCISPSEKSKGCIRARMLCYSNRAAARMAVGRMREALTDCMHAMDIDSKFVRARIRAASCHLALGECDAALKLFKECMGSRDEPETLGVKIATEALEGIRNAQQVEENMNEALKLLNAAKSEDASNALCLVNEALSISPHCENLLELKARALLSLCNYEEVIQVCKESMVSVELNHKCGNCISENPVGNKDTSPSQCYCRIKLQFWQMTGKAHFYLGRLDQALNSLLKYEEENSAAGRSGGESVESLAPLVATINDLLYHKAAGNEAFQVGKYAEAVEHYTAALACNNESRPFTAVCFCNRAAASHGLRHIADGIADCSRAIAIDPEYPKPFSRRAILHEMVRNYGQAINDLQRLVTLQERQEQQAKVSKSRGFGSLGNNTQDLEEARERLAKAEEDLKKGNPLDHYLILGVEPSCTAAEIKRAYRKAALKHHPDKAGQFLVRSDNGDDALLKEFGDEFRRDAEKLFKMIGEAYAVLSEPGKRLRYDTEEELRKLQTDGSISGAETVSEPNRYQYEKDSRCHREGWDSWNDRKNQYQYWQSGPDTSQPDTYTCQGSNNSRSSDGFRWNDYDWDDI